MGSINILTAGFMPFEKVLTFTHDFQMVSRRRFAKGKVHF